LRITHVLTCSVTFPTRRRGPCAMTCTLAHRPSSIQSWLRHLSLTHPNLWRRFSISSAFHKPTPTHRTSLSTQHKGRGLRPSGVFDRWSDGLELTHCLTSSEIRRVVLTVLNSSFIGQSSVVFTNLTSALEVFFKQNALYKSNDTYLLTYLLTYLTGNHHCLNNCLHLNY